MVLDVLLVPLIVFWAIGHQEYLLSAIFGVLFTALIWVGAGSLLTLLLFITERLATRVVALSFGYGADLIIVAYTLVVIAAIIFTVRQRMAPVKTVILLIGLAVLGYILKDTFAPLPAAPFCWDALAAAITLAAGIVLPLAYPPVRRGITNSPLLKAGASALLGTRSGT
jgi:hypothetical protein